MSELILSALAKVLIPFAQFVRGKASRLYAERAGSRLPIEPDLMEANLDLTLGRLRRGNVDDLWWQNILARLGRAYVAPDFLKKPALQEWLADSLVADELKAVAKDMLMSGGGQELEIPERLTQSYSDQMGEASQFARTPILVVVAVLVAGYIASIPPEQKPIAGMFQELHGEIQELHGEISEGVTRIDQARLSVLADPILQQSHSDRAENELANILSLRVFDSVGSRKIQDLMNRLSDGDLVAAIDDAKAKVRYWAARLCAGDTETVEIAKDLLHELRESNAQVNLAVVDALIAETEGDAGKALRLLRDHDDPDSKSVIFGLLSRSEGKSIALSWFERQANRGDPQFFEPIGWVSWALCMAELEKWEEASERLINLRDRWEEMPALAYVEGGIRAAMILPLERRRGVLDGGVPLFVDVVPNQGALAENHHSQAKTCFEFLDRRLRNTGIPNLEEDIADWNLWLRLMEPATQQGSTVREEIRRRMDQGAQAVRLIPFAYIFNISFDTEPLRKYLETRKALGGLDDRELWAECFLFRNSLTPNDFVKYLEQHRARLARVMPLQHLSEMHVDALARDNQVEKAREVNKEYGNKIDGNHSKRLTLLIDTHEGKDTRKQLEALYRETGDLGDLRNLIFYYEGSGDLAALRPLTREQFRRAPTVKHALGVVKSLSDPSCFDHESIVQFLDENADLVEQSHELKTAKVFAFLHAGRYREAREINDSLLQQEADQEDLRLGINIAVASGEWEKLGGILDRVWDKRNAHDAHDLMGPAHLMGEHDPTPDRALQLGKLAAQKAPDDPQILSAVYWLHFHLGRDAEANQDWLRRASELSSLEEGPVWNVSLKDLVTNRLPKHRDHIHDVERKWLAGQLPMTWAAGRHNVPLARLLLHIPDQNAGQSDGRRRAILPIMAGGRESVELQETWTVGLDVSSLMVLFHLGLLEKAFDAFHHTKLAPDVMEHLFRERGEVRFHQPSLIETAKQVLLHHSRNQLEIAKIPTVTSKVIAHEVGPELAALLQMARAENGKVVCVLPIHKFGSLMEQEAQTSAQEDLILPIADFCRLLYDEGKIASNDYQRARSFLRTQGQTESSKPLGSTLDGPVFVDGLALHYLLDAHIFRPVVSAGLRIYVHPRVIEEMQTLTQEGDTGEDLIARIEEIRLTIRNALDSEKASFLPRVPNLNEQIQYREIRYEATASLLAGAAACDVLCIDDRFMNRHVHVPVSAQRVVPIGCVSDVLHHLVSLGSINESDYMTARHKLRQGGFAFVSLECTELIQWLKESKVNNDELTESVELRVLRQMVARADSLNPSNSKEAADLIANCRNVCIQTIFHLWEDQELSPEEATKFSDWIWRNLIAAAIPGWEVLPQDAYRNWVREIMSSRLGDLLLPRPTRSQDRHTHYIEWIQRSVLAPLAPANDDRIGRALSAICEAISKHDGDQPGYGNLFLRGLPEAVRRKAIDQDPQFARRRGYQTERVLSLGTDIHLGETELFAAVRQAFATKGETPLHNIDGKQMWLQVDGESGNVTLVLPGVEESPRVLPELALVSPDRQTRVATLRKVIVRLGPTGPDFRRLAEDIQSRELTRQELSAIFDELANGVTAVQASLVHKISNGLPFNITDMIPQSLSYFERFAGPNPEGQEPETYFEEVLGPHRKGLLKRDLNLGLDICCLGALSDDLSPGQWASEQDNGAVWNALSSCHAESNPFSLLAALDIALYRMQDKRFETFAAEAVAQLCDEAFGQKGGLDFYGLLQACATFVLNRISLLEGGSAYPIFWKRIAAWMQGGLIARTMTESTSSDNLDAFQAAVRGNMVAAGTYAELIDARREPMVFAGRVTPLALRIEILGRIHILKLRHEAEGRQVPNSGHIEQAIGRTQTQGMGFALGFPGPLEGHKRPVTPVPQEISKTLGELAIAENTVQFPLEPFVTASQYFALGPSELECARQLVNAVTENSQDNLHSVLMHLGSASVVAAANRDPLLANSIAEAFGKDISGNFRRGSSNDSDNTLAGCGSTPDTRRVVQVARGEIGRHCGAFTRASPQNPEYPAYPS